MKLIITSLSLLGTFAMSQCAFSNFSHKDQSRASNTKTSQTEYECPAPGTQIDCMPTIDEQISPYCEPKARKWVELNCSDVSFLD